MTDLTGVLLVNLGTPQSPSPRDVYRYLIEFLTDPRVIDVPWLQRQLLVRGLIVPFRYRTSARYYQNIWTKEGSPLLVYGQQVRKALQSVLGDQYVVELAMRYQNPSIRDGLNNLKQAGVKHIIVLPLFPQYASATTGSVHQSVMENIRYWDVIPKISLIDHYATHPTLIEAFCDKAKEHNIADYDHLILSFHGLPERQLRKADKSQHCLKNPGCCQTLCSVNQSCYSAQCYATAGAIAEGMRLSSQQYSVCFQSRLGKDPWIKPYTSQVLAERAKKGDKKILVMCPAFVCDCLETLYEIGVEYKHEFQKLGGEKLDLVEGLNAHPTWIRALKELVKQESNVPVPVPEKAERA